MLRVHTVAPPPSMGPKDSCSARKDELGSGGLRADPQTTPTIRDGTARAAWDARQEPRRLLAEELGLRNDPYHR